MKITITGYQGEGKSRAAREIARVLNKKLGVSVRINDGCMSDRIKAKGEKLFGFRRPADVTINVRQKSEPVAA